MTSPETLKKIAEALGHDGFIVKDGRKSVFYHIYTEPLRDIPRGREFRKNILFDPESNPAQLVEVIKWLLECGWDIKNFHGNTCLSKLQTGLPITIEGEIFETAIMQAAAKQVNQ